MPKSRNCPIGQLSAPGIQRSSWQSAKPSQCRSLAGGLGWLFKFSARSSWPGCCLRRSSGCSESPLASSRGEGASRADDERSNIYCVDVAIRHVDRYVTCMGRWHRRSNQRMPVTLRVGRSAPEASREVRYFFSSTVHAHDQIIVGGVIEETAPTSPAWTIRLS